MNDSQFAGHVGVPNRHHQCAVCRRDLWSDQRRFRNPHNCPPVIIGIDGMERCWKCGEQSFTLTPVTPKPKPAQFEDLGGEQRVLFCGLDCEPGQLDLFETDGQLEK